MAKRIRWYCLRKTHRRIDRQCDWSSTADIGCGTGRHAIRLAAAAGAKVTALDFSEGMLERARAKPGADAVKVILP